MGHTRPAGFPNRGQTDFKLNSGIMLGGLRLMFFLVVRSLILRPNYTHVALAVPTPPLPREPQPPPGGGVNDKPAAATLQNLGLDYSEINGYPEGDGSEDEDSKSYTSAVDLSDGGTRVDPRGSWLSFVQHSSRLSEGSNNKKCDKKKKKKKSKGELENPRRLSDIAPTGLVGPRGPPGPPGPPGNQLSKEELLEEFRDLIKEAAERRAQIIVQERCPSCVVNTTQTRLPAVSDDVLMPHLPIAFHCKLKGSQEVQRKSLEEIANFQTPFSSGSFRRGDGMDVRSGRFTAPRDAIYQFSANLHIHHPVASERKEALRHRDKIRLLICINSFCERQTSLEYISGLESNSRVFTVSLTGLLQLEAGQYASVYVDNSSVSRITIQAGSDFTGILMGV